MRGRCSARLLLLLFFSSGAVGARFSALFFCSSFSGTLLCGTEFGKGISLLRALRGVRSCRRVGLVGGCQVGARGKARLSLLFAVGVGGFLVCFISYVL